MPYLTKMAVTAQNVNGDTFVHDEGTVLSDWELSDFIRGKIKEGSDWYRERFETLLPREAHHFRVQATNAEGPRELDGQTIVPPFDDYVGLHPAEIIERMKTVDVEKARQIKMYEQAGMNRNQITSFVTPSEREPWTNYDAASIGDILEKFSMLSDSQVAEAKLYELNHRGRTVILDYDRAIYERTDGEPEETSPQGTAGLTPEPSPQIPPNPFASAPPTATEGVGTSPDQAQLGQQPPVPPPAPPAPAPIGMPAGG